MSTRARKHRQAKKSKYLMFAILGLMSLLAYTSHYNATQDKDRNLISKVAKPKSKVFKQTETLIPFAERWEKMYADVDAENYLMDDVFKKTRYFFEGYNVASNDEFVLPTEETGAGNPKENYIEDLNDVIAADMVPATYITGGSGAGGGGIGGIGGGGGGAGGGRDNNRTQYVAKDDLETDGKDGKSGNDPSNGDTDGSDGYNGGGSNGGVSAVPVPPAIWLMGSALIGFLGLRRK